MNQIEAGKLKVQQMQLFLLAVLVFGSIVSGCATTGGVQEETEPAVDVEAADIYPGWYEEGAEGLYEDGLVSGFARAAGIEADWTIDNAARQAAANLIYKMDEVLETARREAEAESAAVSDPEFIRELRNAVDSLDPADYPLQSDTYEEDHVTYAVVRIDIPADEALGVIERYLSGHQQTWALVRNRSVLSD